MELSKGDKIRITRNGFDHQEKRLNNGTTLDVVSVSKQGKITLKNEASKTTFILDKDYGHLTHAHCITSHASQGKTVDEVFISQPSSTFSASDARQFYVSVSRGKDAAKIYTDDRTALLENVSELGERQSALELVSKTATHVEHVHYLQRSERDFPAKPSMEKPNVLREEFSKEKDYEPKL